MFALTRAVMQAGLIALVEMLNAKADKYQTAGHEPAVQCLATFCNTKEYVMVIGKIKKVCQLQSFRPEALALLCMDR